MSLHPLYELEPQIYDARRASQVLAQFFSECEPMDIGEPMRLSDNEHELLSFLIHDMCRRTVELEKSFHEATRAEQSAAA